VAQSHTPRSSCVRFVAVVTAGSRNTRLQAARYALPGLDLHQPIAPASWRLRLFCRVVCSGRACPTQHAVTRKILHYIRLFLIPSRAQAATETRRRGAAAKGAVVPNCHDYAGFWYEPLALARL